jgi:hypothetical protein
MTVSGLYRAIYTSQKVLGQAWDKAGTNMLLTEGEHHVIF